MPFGRRAPGDAQQLDAVAEFVGSGEIGRRDRGNALDVDGILIDLAAESETGEQRQLLRGVEAFDVEGGIGLGIAQPLSVGETIGVRQPLLLHPRQDVIAGAIEDAVDAVDGVAGKPFAQGLDHRNGGGDRGFIIQRDVGLLGQLRKLEAMLGQQRLVCRHHRLAGGERIFDRGLGRIAGSAHQFDEHVDAVITGKFDRIGEPLHLLQIDAAVLLARARRHRDHLDGAAAARRQRAALGRDLGDQGGANRAEPGDANSQWLDHGINAASPAVRRYGAASAPSRGNV